MATVEKTIELDGKSYTLMMTRASLRKAEELGLNVNKLVDNPNTQITYLFLAALWGGGTTVSVKRGIEIADAYFDSVDDMATAMLDFVEMYSSVFPTRE